MCVRLVALLFFVSCTAAVVGQNTASTCNGNAYERAGGPPEGRAYCTSWSDQFQKDGSAGGGSPSSCAYGHTSTENFPAKCHKNGCRDTEYTCRCVTEEDAKAGHEDTKKFYTYLGVAFLIAGPLLLGVVCYVRVIVCKRPPCCPKGNRSVAPSDAKVVQIGLARAENSEEPQPQPEDSEGPPKPKTDYGALVMIYFLPTTLILVAIVLLIIVVTYDTGGYWDGCAKSAMAAGKISNSIV